MARGALVEVVSEALGVVAGDPDPVEADKTFKIATSVFYDAVYVPGGRESVAALLSNRDAVQFVREAWEHYKPLAATGDGHELLAAAAPLTIDRTRPES